MQPNAKSIRNLSIIITWVVLSGPTKQLCLGASWNHRKHEAHESYFTAVYNELIPNVSGLHDAFLKPRFESTDKKSVPDGNA